ncbi:RecQ family ATP-dependent DNA helicase [Bizionia myxarmorum]|uniref:ATP-dependent DNA helicase RecQ n=1 Tax=Bizionia myxarmorum TaxID=291186 RepID=A0A5D0R0H9_9FLAO|nr:RecQ family ATP-dependent DNA helicase [Bizionia myxarmorum]TYB74361.1 RecQ family ATP-dependent DNA helicase [Bizionia myxarmorum]
MQQPIDILERYWNYTSFKPLQERVINAVLDGEDTFALMPTGGGKSLCFQVPALAKDGICIVISPLVALMKDQVQALQQRGIKAMALTSGIHYNEVDTMLDNCIYGNYKFLYLSPERLQQELVQDRIRQMPVNLIAIDEAHCISQWGNDFRPAYKNIKLLRELQPMVNCIALTASATPEVVEDIIKELDFISPQVLKQSFKRDNLAYMTFDATDKHYHLERILKKNDAPSIIYVRNRLATIEISQFLETKGFSATYFHGGLSNAEKDTKLQDWLQEKKLIMVATNAFGMGIDKPNVKTVIHLNLPESLESYFQEAGRGGRNGEKAFAVILKNNTDKSKLEEQFLNVLPSVDFMKQVYRKLCNYFQISYGEGVGLVEDFNFNHFCKTYNFNPLIAYNALQTLDRTSIIALSTQFNKQTSVQFIISDTQLFQYLRTHESLNIIVKSILRSYGGIFEHETKINTSKMADKASVSEPKLIEALKTLEKDEIISLQISKTDAQVTFLDPREDEKTINRITHIINQQNDLKHKQVSDVLKYISNNDVCKSVQLLTYFGEKDATDCGICSVCIAQKTKKKASADFKSIKNAIIMKLEETDCSSRTLAETLGYSDEEIHNAIQLLLEHQIIALTATNTYKLSHL